MFRLVIGERLDVPAVRSDDDQASVVAIVVEQLQEFLALEGLLLGGCRIDRHAVQEASELLLLGAADPSSSTAAHSNRVHRRLRLGIGQGVEGEPVGVAPDDRLLTIDAAGFKYFTGRGGVVTPDDGIDTIESVARAYRTRWLVLERDDMARALEPVLRGTSRPSWIGPQLFRVPAPDGGPPRLALYPVCTSAGDTRCGGTTT
jgi:hypothetical protein